MEAPKSIEHEIGGLQNDALRFGLNGVKSEIVESHPLQSAYQSATRTQEEMKRRVLANTYGSAFPMKMDLDRQILSRNLNNVQGSSGGVEPNDNTPLWKFVKKLDKAGGGGGNIQFQCNYCQGTFKGSYSRVKAHLLKLPGHGIQSCKIVTPDHLVEMQMIVDEAEKRMKRKMPKQVPSTNSSKIGSSSSVANVSTGFGSFMHDAFEPRKRKGSAVIEKAFNLDAREELDSEIARMFYSAGLPFHLARNPHYVRSFTLAANTNISGYVPPSYNLLRTTLLQKERANIESLVIPIKESWKESGVTIVCDGWTDPQRRPIINFLAMSISGSMFLKAVNCEGEIKDKFFISNLIKETIQEVGSDNVVQVITDDAPVCRSAGLLVESHYPKVFWTPSVVHTLDLALKNICAAKDTEANDFVFQECRWISTIVGDCAVIKNFIMEHFMRLAIFNEHAELNILCTAETRFASIIVMLRRFKQIKRGLQDMVISDRWASYGEDDVGKATFIKGKILNDDWWLDIDYIITFTTPIYDMLRMADMDVPCLHLVYDMWDSMIDKVKAAIYCHHRKQGEVSTFFSVVHQILSDRWSKSNTPLHCLAHSLNPRFQRPPGVLSSSMLGLEAFTGGLEDFGFEDYLNDPRDSETFRPVDTHHGMEVRLALSNGP